MRTFLLVNNQSPVDNKPLEKGDYVAFISTKGILKIGIVLMPPKEDIGSCVRCLTDGKLYYPDASQILSLDNFVIKELKN